MEKQDETINPHVALARRFHQRLISNEFGPGTADEIIRDSLQTGSADLRALYPKEQLTLAEAQAAYKAELSHAHFQSAARQSKSESAENFLIAGSLKNAGYDVSDAAKNPLDYKDKSQHEPDKTNIDEAKALGRILKRLQEKELFTSEHNMALPSLPKLPKGVEI